MFRATFCPSSGALFELQETHLPWFLYGNRRLWLQFKSAPDDGQNVAQNMFSSVYMTKE
jgi:hypothetical protein